VLRSRLIPCLLIHRGGLVKTIKFSNAKYVGDPLNAVRLFNEKEVDEIIVLDIDASRYNLEPNYALISRLASECRMPLCYGGGVKLASQVDRIVSLGVEKVAISSAVFTHPNLIPSASSRVGNQSIVVVLDVKKTGFMTKSYQVITHNGRMATGLCPVNMARHAESMGAGEIVINSIDRDGTLKGYDYELFEQIRDAVHLPITLLGGAGSYHDISSLIQRYGVLGAAAGSLFLFKGKYRAVLIQYPDRQVKDRLTVYTNSD